MVVAVQATLSVAETSKRAATVRCIDGDEEAEHVQHLLDMLDMFDAERTAIFASDYPHWEFDNPLAALNFIPASHNVLKRRIFVGKPVEGPPRWTLMINSGSSVITARPMASAFRAMPGPLEAVTAISPANEAPIAEVIAAISSSA